MIYVIQSGERDGPIKIGWTTQNPWARLNELQTGNPYRLRLIAFLEGCHPDNEKIFHRLLAPLRLTGEWFAWSPQTEKFVRAIALEQAGLLDGEYTALSCFIADTIGIDEDMSSEDRMKLCAPFGIGVQT
jgi:hypothetical protein